MAVSILMLPQATKGRFMAAAAQNDQKKRTVKVDRLKLVAKLQENCEQHTKDYQEAVEGYRATLLSKMETAFADAKLQMESDFEVARRKVENLKDKDIPNQSEYVNLVDSISVKMQVPRSYEKEYRAAIDMFLWDVETVVELTGAEFNCFVRDEWDWSQEFERITMSYKALRS